jgi:F-type H+-transporting ATPase subunit epsilon
MKCIIVTPEKTILNVHATFVVLPLVDGEYGVFPGHAPLIGLVGAGELRVTDTDGQLRHYYVEGGFAEVLYDTIALMSLKVMPIDDLDLAKSEEQLEQMQSVIVDVSELTEIRQEKIRNHQSRVRVARKMKAK